jgi:hypothetical protein
MGRRKKPAVSPEEAPRGSVVERPDGFYWEATGEAKPYGPFPTRAEAQDDMLSAGGEAPEPGESLQEAESEIGISDWVDPDTGIPAEDNVPHIEDR